MIASFSDSVRLVSKTKFDDILSREMPITLPDKEERRQNLKSNGQDISSARGLKLSTEKEKEKGNQEKPV